MEKKSKNDYTDCTHS